MSQELPVLQSAARLPEGMLEALLPKLQSFVAARVANEADAEELAQDILLKVHQSAGTLSDETRIHGWIWQIARNAIIDHYRRRNHREVPIEDFDFEAKEPRNGVEEIVEGWLVPMIALLPDGFREAVQLSELEGQSHAEVADRLSISLSGAKSRVQRGRAKIREALIACCQFEFDRSGRIVSYRQVGKECTPGGC